MSDLAFNVNGERFKPPAEAAFWRVRRLKSGGRGAPDVIFGPDSRPLMVGLDCEVAEFRRLVGGEPGRYRLDAVDEEMRACEGATPAYLQIAEAGGGEVERRADVLERMVEANAVIVKTNAEIVQSITEKFAAVMESAATLLRAADGAGMPQREPPPNELTVLRNAVAPASEESEGQGSELASVVGAAIEKAMPLLGYTINTKLLGLTPEQSLALLGNKPLLSAAGSSSSGEAAAEG